MKLIIVSVTNDLTTDQRVDKVCNTLSEMGFKVLLIGRKFKNSENLNRNYNTFRFKLLFNHGFLFYAEYNLRLFVKLFFTKKNILLSNDLDTLLPNFLISKIFKSKLVYDSHELFTEVPELNNRPFIKKFWLTLEKNILPHIKNCYTVNSEIAQIYTTKYNIPVNVIRNLAPKYYKKVHLESFAEKIKGAKKMLILQGAGINVDRGAEEAVEAMQYIENCILYIIGSGDVIGTLKNKIKDLNIEEKVFILPKMPYLELMKYTQIADLGLSLDKNTNLNYEFSLPNKIFDYIQAGTPLLVSNRKIIKEIVENNNIGKVIETHNPKEIATCISAIFKNKKLYSKWCQNLIKTANIYNWENESEHLKNIYNNLK